MKQLLLIFLSSLVAFNTYAENTTEEKVYFVASIIEDSTLCMFDSLYYVNKSSINNNVIILDNKNILN